MIFLSNKIHRMSTNYTYYVGRKMFYINLYRKQVHLLFKWNYFLRVELHDSRSRSDSDESKTDDGRRRLSSHLLRRQEGATMAATEYSPWNRWYCLHGYSMPATPYSPYRRWYCFVVTVAVLWERSQWGHLPTVVHGRLVVAPTTSTCHRGWWFKQSGKPPVIVVGDSIFPANHSHLPDDEQPQGQGMRQGPSLNWPRLYDLYSWCYF